MTSENESAAVSVQYQALRNFPAGRIGRVLLAAVCTFGMSTGCGQPDVARYAMDRPSEEEEEAAALAAEEELKKKQAEAMAAEAAAIAAAAGAVAQETAQTSSAPAATSQPAANPAPVQAAAAPAPVAVAEPAKPLDKQGKIKAAIENMQRISDALELYREKTGRYPSAGIQDARGSYLLSWRVLLLPYLGHADLFAKFDLTKPWFVPPNKQLLDQIPAVYQRPGETGSKTRYLMGMGEYTQSTVPGGAAEKDYRNGILNTALYLEVDDELAVPWTQPADYDTQSLLEKKGVGTLREGAFFIGTGGGIVASIDLNTDPRVMREIFYLEHDHPLMSLIQPILPDEFGSDEDDLAKSRDTDDEEAINEITPLANEELAWQYWKAGGVSYVTGRVDDGWQWLTAAIVAGQPASEWVKQYRWVPALRRPAFGLHIAVAATETLPGYVRQQNPAPLLTRAERQDVQKKIVEGTQPFGEIFFQMIEEHARAVAPRAFNKAAETAAFEVIETPLTFLPLGISRSDMFDRAQAMGADVLCVFDSANGGASFELRIYDVMRRLELLKVGKLTYNRARDNLAGLKRRDDVREGRWDLTDFIEDELTPTGFPVELSARVVNSRLLSLAKTSRMSPLETLSEMRYYRTEQLTDDRNLFEALRQVIGKESAEDLLLGNTSAKHRVMRQWLPSDDPEEIVRIYEAERTAMQRRQSAAADE